MSFDRLAPHYTWMERVLAGPQLQRCRIAWLEHLAGCDRILIAGVGHGHFLRACARRFPRATSTSVDASTAMLARARRRAGEHGHRLKYVHASLPQWRPEAMRFDAIVTHFFLDCFEPTVLSGVVDALAHAGRPRARWLLADFTVPPRGWKRQRARIIHGMMYAFFRPVAGVGARCVTPPDDLLRKHGFALAHRMTIDWGLLQSDAWVRGQEGRTERHRGSS